MKTKKIVKNILIIIGGALFFCGLSYFSLSLFFSFHFFEDATINNISVSKCSIQEAENIILSNEKEYKLSIMTNGKTYNIKGSDIDFTYDISKEEIAGALSKQNNWLWFIPGEHDYEVPANVSYNKEKLKNVLSSLNLNESRKKPVDACIAKEDSDFIIKEEISSNHFDEDKVLENIEKKLNNMETYTNIEYEECYTKPKYTYKSLYPNLCQLKKLLQKEISFDCVYEKITISKENMCEFLLYEDNKIDFNSEAIKRYVKEVADKYDTLNATREFTTSNKEKIKVSPGNYGWKIDVELTVKEIKKAFLSDGNSYHFNAKYETTGFKKENNKNDIGSTYVEISISKQHMWFYEDGKLIVDTDIVTGNKDGSHDTPKGVWYVWSKQSPAILVGDDYRTQVSYWMAIDWTGVGIHDSTWRGSSEYGGNTYTYNGSHGCINTPYDAVKTIYNNIEPGTPVVIY